MVRTSGKYRNMCIISRPTCKPTGLQVEERFEVSVVLNVENGLDSRTSSNSSRV